MYIFMLIVALVLYMLLTFVTKSSNVDEEFILTCIVNVIALVNFTLS